jgi:hypothetical protein
MTGVCFSILGLVLDILEIMGISKRVQVNPQASVILKLFVQFATIRCLVYNS